MTTPQHTTISKSSTQNKTKHTNQITRNKHNTHKPIPEHKHKQTPTTSHTHTTKQITLKQYTKQRKTQNGTLIDTHNKHINIDINNIDNNVYIKNQSHKQKQNVITHNTHIHIKTQNSHQY